MAAGVLRTANRLGISVPEELSIAGCDDIALAQQIYPALTTIRQPLRAMSELASLALVNCARGNPHQPGLDVVPGTIQIRESTAPAPE
jgi:LacI family transcriptional regulator